MSEFQTNVQKVTNVVEKVISEMTSRFESSVAELNKLQAKGIEQTNVAIETATRLAQEQIAFAEQLTGEWRKLILATTRSATDLLTPKS